MDASYVDYVLCKWDIPLVHELIDIALENMTHLNSGA